MGQDSKLMLNDNGVEEYTINLLQSFIDLEIVDYQHGRFSNILLVVFKFNNAQ